MRLALFILRLDKQRAMIFFTADQGLTVFCYFFEKLARKCHALHPKVFAALSKTVETTIAYYPGTAEKCLEALFLNVELWVCFDSTFRLSVVDHLEHLVDRYWRNLDLSVVFDSILNCMESAINRGTELEPCVQRLASLAQQMLHESLTDSTLDKLAGYMNVHYIRRLPKYPVQLFYMLRILFGTFISGWFSRN